MPGAAAVPGEKELDLADAIAEDLGRQKIDHVALVIISGDLMTHARWVEYGEAAFEGLAKLCKSLGLERDKILIVPGNHDYEWYTQERDTWTRKALMPGKASSEAAASDILCISTISWPSFTAKKDISFQALKPHSF
jgi:3',5'-cyclic AMP phosphodiesterase CpdA